MIPDHSHPIHDPVTPPDGLPKRPQSVDISLTGKCNLRCRYCFYNDEMVALSDLPTNQWKTFFEELGALAVQRVTLSGGEVFTRPDLFELIDSLIDNRMRYSLLTNGTLITEETIREFEKGKRRLRLDSVQVSIDGSCAEVHNKSRPPHSFDNAIRGLRLLHDAGFPVTVRVTVNHHNIDDLHNIAALLLDDIGLSEFSTNEAEQMGTARCYGQDVLLSEDERQQACDILTSLNHKYPNRLSATAGPMAMAQYFSDIEARLARGEVNLAGRGTLGSCGGVFSKMAVLHDGTMVPCNLLPTLTMGVIGSTPLQKAWLQHPSINTIRYRREIPLKSLDGCRDCEYAGLCSGGCPASVMTKFAQLLVSDPSVCYREHLKKRKHNELL